MDAVWPYLAAILPTILVAILFYFLIKSMLEGDRRERLAQRRFEAEQDRAKAARRAECTTDSEGRTAPPPTGRSDDPETLPKFLSAAFPPLTVALPFGESAANVLSGIVTLPRIPVR